MTTSAATSDTSSNLPRVPTKSDFPPSLTLSITPPTTGHPINILILLHGLGDTHDSFTTLGKNLNLPETACLSIRGPNPIPPFFTGSERPSFHWGDDVLFDEGRGEIELDTGFSTSTRVLTEVIKDVLITKCGYPPRNILLYGYGQGGMAALSLASSLNLELGGIVSIGGTLPSSSGTSQKFKTPVLVCGGSRSKQVTRGSVDRLKGAFENVEYVKWEKSEDSMPRSREEMLPVMKFFARRLRSRAGVPEGAVEV
ncbi:Alpha/Beta hydrolase protein [Halenospora varia]|nr:Alpha/Beta hydrolase protein [Halenospora varia]